MEGLPALDLWDLVIEVFHPTAEKRESHSDYFQQKRAQIRQEKEEDIKRKRKGGKAATKVTNDDKEELQGEWITEYRALAARTNYLAIGSSFALSVLLLACIFYKVSE